MGTKRRTKRIVPERCKNKSTLKDAIHRKGLSKESLCWKDNSIYCLACDKVPSKVAGKIHEHCRSTYHKTRWETWDKRNKVIKGKILIFNSTKRRLCYKRNLCSSNSSIMYIVNNNNNNNNNHDDSYQDCDASYRDVDVDACDKTEIETAKEMVKETTADETKANETTAKETKANETMMHNSLHSPLPLPTDSENRPVKIDIKEITYQESRIASTPRVSYLSEKDVASNPTPLSNVGQSLEMSNQSSSLWDFHCSQCFDFRKEKPSEYYTAIYSLEEYFDLIVYDCSHKLCAPHGNYSIEYHKKMKRSVKVNRNCLIIFDGGLIHAGAPFDRTNNRYRIHMYIHPPGYVKSDNNTYKNGIHECEEECKVCANIFENNGM